MTDPACKQCKTEMVEISDQTLTEIKTTLAPNFKTLASSATGGWWKVCPLCDGYALGMEMNIGFPIRVSSGELTEIHELAPSFGY